MELAPCVAVIGPAGSGKTTFLHVINEALTKHPARPLAYVVMGNPDATGRYLYHVPEEREAFKPKVKGRWTAQTPDTIRSWVREARKALEIVLLDFGGKHDPVNGPMLAECSHYLVLAKRFDDAAHEAGEGRESWVEAARAAGLEEFGRVRSLWATGEVEWNESSLEGAFRADAGTPGDSLNSPLIDALCERLVTIRRRREDPPYVDLQRADPWTAGHLADLRGSKEATYAAARAGSVNLGGKSAIFVFSAAVNHVLDANASAKISIFDPKLPGAFLPIPAEPAPGTPEFPKEELALRWVRSGGEAELLIELLSPDRFLSLDAALAASRIPFPTDADPNGLAVTINGRAPIWFYSACCIWLRGKGAREISVYNASSKGSVRVWPL